MIQKLKQTYENLDIVEKINFYKNLQNIKEEI